MKNKNQFKVGDWVVCTLPTGDGVLVEGKLYRVIDVGGVRMVRLEGDGDRYWFETRFKLAPKTELLKQYFGMNID
jgi:hypothetical protein